MAEPVRPLRVLVIDDNAYDRLLLRRALVKGGWVTAMDEAETVGDGLRRTAEHPYDLIFVDDHLPGEGGGADFVAYLRQAVLPAPVIVLRGHADSAAAQALVEAGALEFLDKSLLTPEGVTQSLRTVLRLREAATGLDRSNLALRFTEQRLGQVVAKAPLIVFSTDRDGVLTTVEGRGLEFMHLDPASLVGRSFFGIHDADSEAADDLRAALRGETVTSVIAMGDRFFDVWYSPLAEGGAIRGAVGVAVDVTELKRAEAAMAASEERWRAAVDNMHDGVIVFTDAGRIVSLNPAAERMFGVRTRDVAGADVALLLHDPQSADPDTQRKSYRLAAGRVSEWQGMRPGGEPFAAEVSMAELPLATGRLFAANVRDITERKELDKMKSDFVSVVSHELRTPVTSLVGALKLASVSRELDHAGDLARLVEIAMRNAERLVGLLGDIIDAEQIETGQLRLRRAPLDLRRAAESAANACVGLMGDTVRLRLTLADEPLGVEGDHERLVQVILNLLSNAVKYSPAGGEVRLRVERAGGAARVSVHDDGPGIPPAFRSRIFGKFQRADASESRKKGGTGLGLAIARGLVEQHGGRIGFETDPGTTFWFEIPLVGGAHA
jgi:PAS domain S-box-containing protein